MANVQFESLRKSYGDNVVVKHVDLEIDDGEFLVLLGPSGCGKSTILRMLAGLESITDGSIKIGDKVVNDLDPAERDIAFVFQNYALYPHMTVKENITFCLKNMRLPKDEIEKRLEEAVKVVELGDLLDRLPGQLSGGQRQRVAIGRTIVRRSKVLLMDEPLSNLDAKLRGAMRAQISRIQDDLGVTTVYVTHDQIEAMTMADRIVVLHDGVVQQVGKPMEIYQKPVNRFVAGFIGSPSMNFVDVEVQEDGDTLRVKASGVNVPLSSEISKRLAGYVGDTITMGFRPQGVEAATEAGAFFTGVVEVVEPYGPETYITLKLGDRTAIGRLSPEDDPIKGESFGLTTKVESLFFFDPATDAAIR